MSKLSGALKALINASHARPGTLPAPKHIATVYDGIATDAASKNVGLPAWLTLSTAVTMTMNSPDSLLELHRVATASSSQRQKVYAAELMREVGLKCISFNGIPRTINCLGAFHAGLPADISSLLSKSPTRNYNESNINVSLRRGSGLWKSIYDPFDEKLTEKLAQSHPDLPVHIHDAHYSNLLSDPPKGSPELPKVGRVLTSLVAIACLRTQTGVGPQVLSHVFGLRKAYEDESYKSEGEQPVEGGKWLANNDGSVWMLELVDKVVGALSQGTGTTFAPGLRAKL
jgi:hypothetical protein